MRHIHPIEPILTVALIIILVVMMRKRREKEPAPSAVAEPRPAATRPARPQEPPEAVYARLRQQALETNSQSLGSAGQVGDDEPYGAVMEMGVSSSVVTLACFADGDAGIYYQSGGGMRGGGAHERVRKAAKEFVTLAGKALPRMVQTSTYPFPDTDRVRFYTLTPRGVFTSETDRESLADPANELSSLFYSGQEVVTQMRQVQEQKAQ